MIKKPDEINQIVNRYAKRRGINDDRYIFTNPSVFMSHQEKLKEILKVFRMAFPEVTLSELKLIEVGCGSGDNLLDFLRCGFMPQNLCGIELLPERVEAARSRLPSALSVYECDAKSADVAFNSLDVVVQSTVFSSILDDDFQQGLADHVWRWVKPGGGVLWYDFIYNNPSNPDVRGVPVNRVRQLFPNGKLTVKHITLAPPISRRVCRIHPNAYHLFNALPLLRTHVLCWIEKTN